MKYEVKIIKGCDLAAQCFSAPKGCEQGKGVFKTKQNKQKTTNK